MELAYRGRYYDGRSPQPQTVNIVWMNNGLLIRYADAQGGQVEVKWDAAHISHTQLSRGIVSLAYGDTPPYGQLDVTDPDFIGRYRREYTRGLFRNVKLTGLPLVAGLLALGCLLVWLVYMVLLPLVADYAAKAFPVSYEVSVGEHLYRAVLEEESIDSAKTVAINAFFRQLNVKSDYPVRITVVKKPVVNAFALPGGGIVVYDGILQGMDSSAQLAALLSHEFSHVQMKHATRNLFRTFAGYIFVSALFGDVSGIAAVLIDNAHRLRTLSYSRELEMEADNNGLRILEQNGISAGGMKRLFEQLRSGGGPEVSEIISTHPDLDNRIRNVELFEQTNPYTLNPNDSLELYYNEIQGIATFDNNGG